MEHSLVKNCCAECNLLDNSQTSKIFGLQLKFGISQEWELIKTTKDNTGRAKEIKVLGGITDIPEGCIAIQRDLERLEKWTDRNLLKLSKGKCKVLYHVEDNPMKQHSQRAVWPEVSSAGRTWRFWGSPSWLWGRNAPSCQKWSSVSWGTAGKTFPEGWGRWSFLSSQPPWGTSEILGPGQGSPAPGRQEPDWMEEKVKTVLRGLEDLSWLWSWNCSAWEGMKNSFLVVPTGI